MSGSEDKTIRIWDATRGFSAHKITTKDETQIGLNLIGTNIEAVLELSDTNLMLLHQRGAREFSERDRERFIGHLNYILGSQDQDGLKLDLSQKSINDKSAWG